MRPWHSSDEAVARKWNCTKYTHPKKCYFPLSVGDVSNGLLTSTINGFVTKQGWDGDWGSGGFLKILRILGILRTSKNIEGNPIALAQLRTFILFRAHPSEKIGHYCVYCPPQEIQISSENNWISISSKPSTAVSQLILGMEISSLSYSLILPSLQELKNPRLDQFVMSAENRICFEK